MKQLLLFVLVLFLGACKESSADDMYATVNLRFVSENPEMELREFGGGRLTVRDMNDSGQRDVHWPCHGDTTVRLVKSFYEIKYEGTAAYRLNGIVHTARFRSKGNFQVLLIQDTTVAVPLLTISVR